MNVVKQFYVFFKVFHRIESSILAILHTSSLGMNEVKIQGLGSNSICNCGINIDITTINKHVKRLIFQRQNLEK